LISIILPSGNTKKTGGGEMELIMNTRREFFQKMSPEYKKAKKKKGKRSEMNSFTSPVISGRMPPGFFPIKDEKLILPDRTAKNIE